MAVKTITIDVEAYELLSRNKREGQSFSKVIKEHFSSNKTGKDLKAALQEARVSEATLKAIDAQVKARQSHLAQAPDL
jgi:predicted CopG family antitoxin